MAGRTFNTFEIDTSANGPTTSRLLATPIDGTTLRGCADAAPHGTDTCSGAAPSTDGLSVADGVFTGVDAARGDTVTFQDNGLLIVLGQPGSAVDGLLQLFDY